MTISLRLNRRWIPAQVEVTSNMLSLFSSPSPPHQATASPSPSDRPRRRPPIAWAAAAALARNISHAVTSALRGPRVGSHLFKGPGVVREQGCTCVCVSVLWSVSSLHSVTLVVQLCWRQSQLSPWNIPTSTGRTACGPPRTSSNNLADAATTAIGWMGTTCRTVFPSGWIVIHTVILCGLIYI